MHKKTAAIASLLLIAGCTTQMNINDQQPVPTSLKAQILTGAKNILYDPHSVRDAEISGFIPSAPGSNNGFICVKANAKNLYGAYTGRQGTLVFVNGNKVTDAIANHPMCDNAAIRFHPFPELETL